MSGGSGFDVKAFNPFNEWGEKSLWEKIGFGLPIGKNLGSPKWIKEHPNEALAAAAVAATVLSMGAASPALAGGAAGAAGAAEAGAGAAAGMGSGLLAADYAAMGLGGAGSGLLGAGAAAEMGAGAAGGGLLGASSGMMPAAAYGGELASIGELGGSMLGGAAPQSVTVLPGDWQGPLNILEKMKGANWKKGLKAYQTAQQYQKLSQPPMAPPAGKPPGMQGGGGGGNELAQLSQLFSNPVGQAQIMQYLRARGLA